MELIFAKVMLSFVKWMHFKWLLKSWNAVYIYLVHMPSSEKWKCNVLHLTQTSRTNFIWMIWTTYSIRAPNTNRMHANIHASMAVSPSAFGVLVVTLLKMLTNTRNRVTSKAILPGITSIGIKNEIQLTMTNNPLGR